jgi:bacillithiol system protein YtxJ
MHKMSHDFRELTSIDGLDAAVARSVSHPVVLFKHSRTCGTSAQAYDELQAVTGAAHPADVYLVTVQASRPVSNAIASRFGIRHESPQVLVVHDGAVVWHASHFRVTADAVQAAVTRLATTDASALPS